MVLTMNLKRNGVLSICILNINTQITLHSASHLFPSDGLDHELSVVAVEEKFARLGVGQKFDEVRVARHAVRVM
jgi:hypothetical protein